MAVLTSACQGYPADVVASGRDAGTACEVPAVAIAPDAPLASQYQVSNDGTTTDMVTGLVWQTLQPDNPCPPYSDSQCPTSQQAQQYCESLNLGGLSSGWRLPSQVELVSIVDYDTYGPAVPWGPFLVDHVDQVWASPIFANGNPEAPVMVNLGVGSANVGLSGAFGVLCVNAPTPPTCPDEQRYIVSDGTVLDRTTQLTWQQAAAGPLPWMWNAGDGSAQAYCAELTLDGAEGWRLPSVKELFSIVDFNATGGGLDAAVFPVPAQLRSYLFWTATSLVNDEELAWAIDFMAGNGEVADVTQGAFVRCVRSPT
jgi:hypothetical protein